MGLFSNVLKRVKEGVPQALEQRRNPGFGIGSLMARPDLEPRGGGFLKRVARNVNQQIKSRPLPIAPPGGIRPLPIRPPSIGRPIPPISIGGIGGGRPMPGLRVPGGGGIDYGGGEGPPLLPLQPPADDPLLRPRVDPIARQEPIPLISNPLVPGSAEPREQTGLTAAELLELSDEELQRYIPRKSIGNMYNTYDATPSPEDFRTMLQAQLNPDPNDLRAISMGPRLYNPIDTSPQPTQDKRLGRLLDIRGTGGDTPTPRPSIGGAGGGLPDLGIPIPPQDFGFGPGIRPTEIRGPDGRIIGPAGVTPPDFVRNIENKGPGSLRDRIDVDRFVPPQQPPRVPLSERTDIFGAGKRYDPANLPEGFSFQDTSGMMRTTVMPPPGFVYAYGPDGERRAVPSGEAGAAEMRDQGAARDQAFLDFQKTNPGEVFLGGLTPPPPTTPTGPSEIPVADIAPDPVATPAPVIPPAPVTPPASTTVAANQPPVAPPAPTQPPATTTDGVGTAPAEPAPTTTTAPPQVSGETPFAAGVTQVQSGMDPLTEQLLFGIGGQGGFIPGAMRAAEKVFYDDQGQPIVIDEQVAGFSPDQLAAMQMQRQSIGMQQPYLQGAAGAYGAGTQALEEGLQRGRTAAIGALGATQRGVGSLQRGLGESADILRGTIGGYDPSMTERFYDPYEDRVVQQTIKDIMEQGAKADIGARAGDIARGGESAFGSRARLGAGERQEALGRGLAEAVSGIRSQGFREAQQTGLGEFARQKAAERAASTGLAGLAGQGFGGAQALAGALTGLGGTEQEIGQQRYSGQFGLGSSLQGLGAQAAGASASDIASLYGMGSQQQGQAQQMLDAQRRNLQQRQMTPLLQYQALAPFVSMAPAGQFQTTTQFAPKPSAMQAGLGTGLSAFGALGQLYGGKS